MINKKGVGEREILVAKARDWGIKYSPTPLLLIIFLMGLILISGCTTTETIVYNNITIKDYINTTHNITELVYVDKIIYINTTKECSISNEEYMDRLIRDYERCSFDLEYLNKTNVKEINYDLNVSLKRCNEKIEEMKEFIRDK